MKPFIYLPQRLKNDFKEEIDLFVNTYMDRIAPVFASIDDEAERKTDEYFEQLGMYCISEYCDPGDYADQARDFGYEYWAGLALMQYNTRLMNISTLYQFWEQQLRGFAFSELTRQHTLADEKGRRIEFTSFCTKFNEIEQLLMQCGVGKNSLVSWDKINELRLLQNVIKHGDGTSASQLEQIRPDIFRIVGKHKAKDLYLTTLNERVLDIEDSEIVTYGNALKEFWDELPEHMYLK